MIAESKSVEPNPVKEQFMEQFNRSVNELIDRSPFYNNWKPGKVEQATADKFLSNFNLLVGQFPRLIALGAARAEDEDTRTVLAVNLMQECGDGDVRRTHHAIYRRFLETAGVNPTAAPPQSFASEWGENLCGYIRDTPSSLSALGALATGEFLAPPGLSRIFDVIKPLYPQADIEYFTTHLALEVEHIEELALLLARQTERGAPPDEVVSGFERGIDIWEKYFENLNAYLFH